jgi:glycosyltransferase involved in cell wall biosynthesis
MELDVLVVAYSVPKPDTHACQRRLQALLAMMAAKHRVVYCPIMDEAAGGSQLAGDGASAHQAALADLRVELVPPGIVSLQKTLRNRRFDVVFLEYWRPAYMTMQAIRWWQPGAGLILDTVDVHFAREWAGVRLGVFSRDSYRRNRWREVATCRAADAVIAISEADRNLLRNEGRMPEIEVVPIVMPVRSRGAYDPMEVVFIGGFAHHPNLDGILWFASAIWPQVLASIPDARLTIIGSRPPPEVLALGRLRGVQVLGWVPDTAPYIDRAGISIAPLRYGGGMKGKVTEALASAIPVVTTSAGAEGFGARPGEDLLVADSEEAFAAGVVELLRDPAHAATLGRAGQRLVAPISSPEAIAARLDALLRRVATRPQSGAARLVKPFLWRMKWLSATLPRAAGEKLGLRFER